MSTGNPILDASNAAADDSSAPASVALENNRPSQSSPLKDSVVTAADLQPDPPVPAPESAAAESTTSEAAAPGSTSAAPSVGELQEQAKRALSQASTTASSLASQASQLAQQATSQLPAAVSAYLPSALSGPAMSQTVPPQHTELPVTNETRETTTAPLVDSQLDRPVAVHQPLVPGSEP